MTGQRTPLSEANSHANEPEPSDSSWDPERLRPDVTSADTGPSGHYIVHFDSGIADMRDEIAARRAPTPKSKDRHSTGTTGEIGTACRLRVPVDREIHPPYEGDEGFDLLVPAPGGRGQYRVQVKTTTNWAQPEATVGRDEIHDADYFVLCRMKHPSSLAVEIVGCASRPQVRWLGETYARDGYCLRPDYLRPMGPGRLEPDEVREILRDVHSVRSGRDSV